MSMDQYVDLYGAIEDRGVLLLDHKCQILKWNNWLERYTGTAEIDVIGRQLDELYPAITERVASTLVQISVEGRGSLVLSPAIHSYLIPIEPSRLQKKAGVKFMYQLTKGMTVNLKNGHHGLLLFIDDATERILQERTVSKAMKQLELEIEENMRINAERRQLEAQLRHSEKMRGLGTLAGGVAHDFNNILSIILGYSELYLDVRADDAEGVRLITKVHQATERGRKVVNQLLYFVKAKEKTMKSTHVPSVIADVISVLQTAIPDNVEVQENIAADSPPILADETQLSQLFTNLFMNAIDAMTGNGGSLYITLTPVTAKSLPVHLSKLTGVLYLKITIRDTGAGMTPETRERIFEPFFTTKGLGGTGTNKSKDGAGLGLSVVYNIVQYHNGVIEVCSEPEKGTTFDLYFPVIADEAVGR